MFFILDFQPSNNLCRGAAAVYVNTTKTGEGLNLIMLLCDTGFINKIFTISKNNVINMYV